MPILGVRNDLGVGETPHLAANRFERLVKARMADCALVRVLDQLDERGAIVRRVTDFITAATTGSSRKGSISDSDKPKSVRRMISPWFIGMPPRRYARCNAGLLGALDGDA